MAPGERVLPGHQGLHSMVAMTALRRAMPARSWSLGQLSRSLLDRRRLIRQLIRREIDARYRGSVLGLLWSFLTPLILLAIYTFVFGVVFRTRWPQLADARLGGFALVLFCGLIALSMFSECLSRAPGLIVNAASYVKRVVFPLDILPVVALGSALFHASVSLGVLVLAHLALGGALHWTLVLVPLVVAPFLLLALGLSYLLAALGVFFRDIGHVVPPVLQVLMFMTPIFYPLEALPENLRPLLHGNPLTAVVEDLRRVVLWGLMPDWPRLAAWTAIDGLALTFGYACFAKTRNAFADVL